MTKRKTVRWVLNSIFILLLAGMFAFFFWDKCTNHRKTSMEGKCIKLTQWEWIHEDGDREKVEAPQTFHTKKGGDITLETVLPEDITDETWIGFLDGREHKIWIDGELRSEYHLSEADIPGDMVKSVYHFLKLTREDAGKTLRMFRKGKYDFWPKAPSMYLGSSYGLVEHYLNQSGISYVMGILLLITAFVFAVIGGILQIKWKKKVPVVLMCVTIMMGALWYLFDSFLYQLVFHNYYIDGWMAYMLSLLLPFPFICYINLLQEYRYEKVYQFLKGATLLNAAVFLGLNNMSIVPFDRSSSVLLCVEIVIAAAVAVLLVYDRKKGRTVGYSLVVSSLVAAAGLFIVQMLCYSLVDNGRESLLGLLALWVILIGALAQQIVDISRMEQEKKVAENASKAKTEFLAKMSHEIRTPLHGILGLNEMIMAESRNPKVLSYAADLRSSAERILGMVNELLDTAKIEAGKMELVMAEYPPMDLLSELSAMMKQKAEKKGLYLKFETDKELPSVLYGDDVKIRQVLQNLLSNAVKYTEEGGVTCRVSAEFLEADMVLMHYSVKDTEIGIREEDKEKLFSEYQRIDQEKNRYVEGTGLGMNITIKLLQLMGSELVVESEYGKGSCFSFGLLQRVVDKTPAGDFAERKNKKAQPSKRLDFTTKGVRALVVDDQEVNRTIARFMLNAKKVEVEEAEGGRRCLEMVLQNEYDVIFLDHMMPDIDGMEVLKELSEYKKKRMKIPPVVMFTANIVDITGSEYEKEGAAGALMKPFKPVELDDVLLKVLPGEKIVS